MNVSNFQNIAFVTGYIGPKKRARIPVKPPQYDGYYITNNKRVLKRLRKTQWTPIFIKDTMSLISELSFDNPLKKYNMDDLPKLDKIDRERFFTMACKPLKTEPQKFIPKPNLYHYIIWSDNKINVNIEGTITTIKSWNTNLAMMLHRHPFVANIEKEYDESMLQERYVREKEQYAKYINKNVNEGLSAKQDLFYQCGYIIYNLQHPETLNIQKTWKKHIGQCGINDQISFNFVAQQFNSVIGEYKYDIGQKIVPLFKQLTRKLKLSKTKR